MLNNLSIRLRLLILLTAVATLTAGISTYVGYDTARQSLELNAFNKLTTVREIQARQVEDYFRQIRNQVVTLSENRMIVEAMQEFNSTFYDFNQQMQLTEERTREHERRLRLYYEKEFLSRLEANLVGPAPMYAYWPDDPDARMLQALYIALNPFDTGSKHLLDAAEDGSSYSDAHKRYHPLIRNYLERFGYYDIFLVNHLSGRIVYSVFKEVDFGTSLLSGPYSNTNFAAAFRAVRQAQNKDFVLLEDFKPYPPSYNGQASFIASPIFDQAKQVGVLIFQMPVDRINAIMTNHQQWKTIGLGASGETYIVGEDLKLRTEPRFLLESPDDYLKQLRQLNVPAATLNRIKNLNSAIGLQEVNTKGSTAALAGQQGTQIFPDYRGVPVLSSYRPLEIPGLDWVILSEIDTEEAFAAATRLRNRMILWLLALVAGSLLLALFFSRGLIRPLQRLAQSAQELAAGDLDTGIHTLHQDEIGHLARSLEAMRGSIKDLVERQASMIDALSTPLIPLQDDVVVLPLVGEFDERRILQFQKTLSEGIHRAGARAAIIDITGVSTYTVAFARALEQAAVAARLLGAQLIITGMQPALAESLAQDAEQMQGVVTLLSLQDGLDYAVARKQNSWLEEGDQDER